MSLILTAENAERKKEFCEIFLLRDFRVLRGKTREIDGGERAPGVTRTLDLRIRNPLLYPAELRAQWKRWTLSPGRRENPVPCGSVEALPKGTGNGLIRDGNCGGKIIMMASGAQTFGEHRRERAMPPQRCHDLALQRNAIGRSRYSPTRCLSSQTRRAARRRDLVRVRVPAAAIWCSAWEWPLEPFLER